VPDAPEDDLASIAHARRTGRRQAEERALAFEAIAEIVARWGRLALNRTEAAEALGVSVEFFDRYIAHELRRVRRGRRVMFPVAEIMWWLWLESEDRSTDRPGPSGPDPEA
jgi:hypothetical protein